MSHPDYIEYVLVTNRSNFVRGNAFRMPLSRRIFGNGLFNSEGNESRAQRTRIQPAFQSAKLDKYSQLVVDYCQDLVAHWQNGETRDIHADMAHLTLRIMAKALFSSDIQAQGIDLDVVMRTIVDVFASPYFLFDNYLPTANHRRFYKATRRLETLAYGLLRERLSSHDDPGDLLSALLQNDVKRPPDQEVRDQIITFLMAGHETTAVALSWTWYLLSQDPEVENRFFKELATVLEGRTPTIEDFPKLRFTEAIVMESMRLYPPVWALIHRSVQDCEIAGYRVKRGAQLIVSQWVVHRDARFYDEPLRFNPDRWTEEFSKRLPRYAYFPFGAGPRACIGKSFAMMEAVLVLASIGQSFCFRLAPNYSVIPCPLLTLRPQGGLKMIVTARTN